MLWMDAVMGCSRHKKASRFLEGFELHELEFATLASIAHEVRGVFDINIIQDYAPCDL